MCPLDFSLCIYLYLILIFFLPSGYFHTVKISLTASLLSFNIFVCLESVVTSRDFILNLEIYITNVVYLHQEAMLLLLLLSRFSRV